MMFDHQVFIMQVQPHILRYVGIGVGAALAAGIGAYYLHRRNKHKENPVTEA